MRSSTTPPIGLTWVMGLTVCLAAAIFFAALGALLWVPWATLLTPSGFGVALLYGMVTALSATLAIYLVGDLIYSMENGKPELTEYLDEVLASNQHAAARRRLLDRLTADQRAAWLPRACAAEAAAATRSAWRRPL